MKDRVAGKYVDRVDALDGLRGLAAFVVVVFHYLCFFEPTMISEMSNDTTVWVDTPVGLFWNGPFAVSVFFVLSGFVIAGAAERRRNALVSNAVTRYLRLAVPATVSVLVAWLLLGIFPGETEAFRNQVATPSPWLRYTYQVDIPSVNYALQDGFIDHLRNGGSNFNNVLWTMQIELLGSLLLFAVYWLTAGHLRLAVLFILVLALPVTVRPYYVAFALGALAYEFHVRGQTARIHPAVGWILLIVGWVFGSATQGTHERWGLPDVPGILLIGETGGLVPVLAASLILVSILALPSVQSFLSGNLFRWLGRISFSLYLLHVPLIYTVVAALAVEIDLSTAAMVLVYFPLVFGLAHLMTISVDEPVIRRLALVRSGLGRIDLARVVSRRIME